jgi:uncharacterized protein (TIGR02246 family)
VRALGGADITINKNGRAVMETYRQADVQEIEDILRRLEVAENTGNSSEIAHLLAEDAVIMVPNQPVQEGRTACARFVAGVMAGLLAQFDRHIVYVSAEIRVIGEYGFDRGSFTFTVAPRSGGEMSRETGKYLFLYSRAADGQWKVARAIVNLDDRDREEPAR